MDIGRDNGGVVDLAYEDKAPYAFTGTVKQVVFDLKPATHKEEKPCTSTTRRRRLRPASPAEGRMRPSDDRGGRGRGRRSRGVGLEVDRGAAAGFHISSW
jgi:hypothetical protein